MMNDLALERELRSTLHSLVPNDVPVSLFDAVAALPAGRRSWLQAGLAALPWPGRAGNRLATATMSLVAVALVAVLGTVVVVGYGLRLPGTPGAGDGPRAFDWHTQVAALEADSVAIDAGGRTFSVPANADVASDPGDSTYRTLELTWTDQGVEQRLFIYFAADSTNWWVSEMRTYNGAQQAQWIYYSASQVKAARGRSYLGDLDLAGTGGNGNGRLRIENMRLTAFAPGTGVTYADGCHPVGPISQSGDQPVVAHGNPDVQGVALRVGMPASEADAQLTDAAICHEFRYDYPASNYGQTWCTAPPGDINWWVFGSEGQLILFIEAAPSETLAPEAPQLVGC
jgi:hypothetical protein